MVEFADRTQPSLPRLKRLGRSLPALMVFENKMQQRRGGFSPPHRLDHGEGRGKPAPTSGYVVAFNFQRPSTPGIVRQRSQSRQRRLNGDANKPQPSLPKAQPSLPRLRIEFASFPALIVFVN